MKKLSKRSLINLGLWLLLSLMACNSADKKSSLKKDSVGGDMAMPNRVGGSETYETKLDEAAADHLKHITSLLLMEYHLFIMQRKNNSVEASPTLERLIKINRLSFKRIEAYAAEKKVILPSVLLNEQQIGLDSLKALPPAAGLKRHAKLLKVNGAALLKALQLAADNREQDFKSLMNEEFTYQQQKNRLVNSL
ncbi:hypothetical protein SAMN05421827_12083 [Pedobacter terrae]|uniref:DUF4142 domain-containing protein n=1 Tax=Pedobacter terrae TaxID=405671 RepID=A0A1G8B0S0_9SPHI|nr:hypothetical protein [Pedobacter terrae]SDH26768.1 hypothetical protein SAMN05421827_12083 [Pedobacter terrae]